ncbi:MAG: hypothetical protein JXA68_09130 [Ignavibacteriales bacterium]|nr:hypothetical protein [Ignavibacteriales bacterium]
MKNLSDDILNRYIDNELNIEELENVNTIVNDNPNELEKLKTHSFVDNILKKLTRYFAPADATEKIMDKIYAITPVVKIKGKKFFLSVISLFASVVLGIIIYSIITIQPQNSESGTSSLIQEVNEILKNLNYLNIFWENNTLLIIMSIFTFVLLLGGYFFKDAHKTFMRRLENISPKTR